MYLYAGRFCDLVVIGTAEGSILVIRAELDDDERIKTVIEHDYIAEHLLFGKGTDSWYERDMIKAGVISSGDHLEMLKKRAEELAIREAAQNDDQEKKNYALYLKFKERFELVSGTKL